MTTAERSFYGVLSLALKDDGFCIFSKVRLADLLYLPNNTINRQAYWNKIQSKHIDFVVCDKKLVKPLLAIELDDSSHSYSERVERDIFVNQALQEAGLNIVRVKAANTYIVNDIEQLIAQYLQPLAEKDEAAATVETSAASENINEKENITVTNNAPICPKCGIPMVERIAKRGDKAGERFYGCPNYPKCKEVVSL